PGSPDPQQSATCREICDCGNRGLGEREVGGTGLKADDLAKLIGQLKEELATRPAGVKVAIVGRTPTALDIISFLTSTSTSACFLGIYAEGGASAGNVSDVG